MNRLGFSFVLVSALVVSCGGPFALKEVPWVSEEVGQRAGFKEEATRLPENKQLTSRCRTEFKKHEGNLPELDVTLAGPDKDHFFIIFRRTDRTDVPLIVYAIEHNKMKFKFLCPCNTGA